jgi:hypothetical protein
MRTVAKVDAQGLFVEDVLLEDDAQLPEGCIEQRSLRTSLACAVLRGKAPKPVEKRWWNRATEAPVLLDVWDWTDDRHIFSVLVWPALEIPPERAHEAHRERAKQVSRVIHAGAAEMTWSTRYEMDYGLRWDAERQVWVATDGFACATPESRVS